MPSYISPGVYTLERDLSQYVSNLSTTIVSIVGTANKGPVNVPTLVTSATQYVQLFGQPQPSDYLGYAALSFLEQGHTAYITRVTAGDATTAKLTVPIPADYDQFVGNWALTSNTTSTATFTISNKTGATGAAQMVVLPATPDVSLSGTTPSGTYFGFDFTDSTNMDAINGKVGSDLKSFISAGLVASCVNGRTFTVNTGAGKGSSVQVTNLVAGVDPTTLDMTVNATRFNTFNSPLLTSATGTLVFQEVPSYDPTTAVASLAVIGATNNTTPGTVTLAKKVSIAGSTTTECDALLAELTSPVEATWLTAIDGCLSTVVSPDIIINTPLYTADGATIVAADVAKTAVLVAAILNTLVNAFRLGSTALSGYANLAAAYPLCASIANGITGVGSYNSVSGVSNGYKSATVQTDGITIVLAAITLGASGNFEYTGVDSLLVATNMGITGTFALNLARPTWIMNQAGANFVPTLFKFSSNGQGDFSNIAITVDLNKKTLDAAGEQQYTVSLYIRSIASTIALDSVAQVDFTLVESFVGTPEVLQSTINAKSAYAQLKIDYSLSTGTIVNYSTDGSVVNGTINENLVPSFGLFADASGLGVYSGGVNSGTTLVPSYNTFLANGFAGSPITKYDIIGDLADKTGVYSVADAEKLDINLIIAPGWSADPDVASALIKVCDPAGGGRGDCMTILDTPFGLGVQDVINYRNNILISGSNYAAVYYPWVQIVDSVNQKNIFVPPSGMVAGQYAYNDTVGDVYTAPAGRNRGVLYDAISLERVLNLGDRDQLTLANINPIYSEAGFGIYIRGQMTMQRATTALNRVNVRRLLLNLRKVIATASKYFEFEPGDAITALRLKQLAESTLTQRLNQGAIRSFTVDVGSDVNTAQTLENNQLVMSISIVPTKTAEIIVEIFNILPQGQGLTLANG